MSNIGPSLCLALCFALVEPAVAQDRTPPAPPRNLSLTPPELPLADGWTLLEPSADSRVIFVSSSQGSDTNPGTEAAPVATLTKAYSMVRDGFPDWMRLRRGDVWEEGMFIRKSGRSIEEPIVITEYGEGPRPRIDIERIGLHGDNFAFVSLHFRGDGKNNSPRESAIETTHDTIRRNFLFEDIVVEGHRIGLNLRLAHNWKLRRSLIVSNSQQGILTYRNDKVLIEECVFDDNGIDNLLHHNIYFAPGLVDLVVRGNIFSRGANYGVKLRARSRDVRIEGNLFALNRNSMAVHLDSDSDPTFINENTEVLDNVFLNEGRDGQQSSITLQHCRSALVRGNVFAHSNHTRYATTLRLEALYEDAAVGLDGVRVLDNKWFDLSNGGLLVLTSNFRDLLVAGNEIHLAGENVCVNFRANYEPGQVSFQGNSYFTNRVASQWFELGRDNQISIDQWKVNTGELDATQSRAEWKDPSRDVEAYHASIGREATFEAFIQEARRQSKTFWRTEYAPSTVVAWIREGFSDRAE